MATNSEKPHIIDPHADFAALELSVYPDTAHDAHTEAVRDIYTEMLMAGAGTYDRAAFLDAWAHLGASGSVYASNDTIRVSVRARNEVLKKALALMTLAFEKPRFEQKELVRIKKRLSEELKLAKENAKARAYQHFVNTLVPANDRRYEYDIDALRAALQKITIADIRAFHKNVRNAPAGYAAGGTDTACRTILGTLTKLNLYRSTLHRDAAAIKMPTRRTVVLVDIPHKANIEFSLGSGVPLLRTDPDFTPLFFGLRVLGIPGGFAGRLMSIVREKEGLTYGIYANLESFSEGEQGMWRISTFFAPKDAVQGITSTLREVERIRTKGITEDELLRFKQILATRFSMVDDSLLKRVSERHGLEELGLTPEMFTAFKKDIASLTTAQVNAALKKYLDPSHIVISGAGPIKSVEKELKKFAQ
jgi:zinc protease